jgi:hypothetical protein
MNYTYEDLEHMTVEELKACLEWAKEEIENGNDYRS